MVDSTLSFIFLFGGWLTRRILGCNVVGNGGSLSRSFLLRYETRGIYCMLYLVMSVSLGKVFRADGFGAFRSISDGVFVFYFLLFFFYVKVGGCGIGFAVWALEV